MLFALTGERPGTAKTGREGGRLRVEARLSGGGVPEGTAAVLAGGRICLVKLSSGRGYASCPGEPEALLIIDTDGRVLAEGGFAGRAGARERVLAEARLRLYSKRAEGAAQSAGQPDGGANGRAALGRPEAREESVHEPQRGEPIEPFRVQTAKSAPQSEALKEILTRAGALFGPLSLSGAAEKPAPVGEGEPPMLHGFPEVRWKRVQYPGTGRYYLEGVRLRSGARVLLYAVPGEYSPSSPMRRKGFTAYTSGSDGLGYWVRMRRV